MENRKKTVSKAVIALILLPTLLLQGCKGTQSPQMELTGQTLTVVTPFGEGDGYQAVYQGLLNSFQEKTGCSVTDRSERSSERWKQDVLNSFDSGTEPDVLFFFTGEAADGLVQDRKVVDINTIRSYESSYAMQINPSVLNTMKAKDSLNYCVPVTGYWEGLYVNQDLFDAHNIALPSTMDELLEAVDAFNDAGIVPIAANLKTTPHYWFEYILYSYTGPSGHNQGISDASLRSAMEDSFSALKTLYDRGAFHPDIVTVTDEMCTSLFVNKEAAMMLDGSWAAGSIQSSAHVQVAYMPAIDGGARKKTDIISGFSMGYYITQKAWEQKREAAVAFVNAMTGEEALSLFNANGSASPGPKMKTAETTEFVASTERFIESATAFVPALQDSFDKEAREYLFEHVLDVLSGKIDSVTIIDEFLKLNR